MSFIPASPVGEAAAHADAAERGRHHRTDGLSVFGARSPRGRGHLLISPETVSFHPRRGAEVVHGSTSVQLTRSKVMTQVCLVDGAGSLTVSVPGWERGRLVEALHGAGIAIT